MVFLNTYGAYGMSSWEFPELKTGAYVGQRAKFIAELVCMWVRAVSSYISSIWQFCDNNFLVLVYFSTLKGPEQFLQNYSRIRKKSSRI